VVKQVAVADIDKIDGCILKGKSPSCGIKNVKLYSSPPDPVCVGFGIGLLPIAILRKCPDMPMEDEVRLEIPEVEERFLKKVFEKSGRTNMDSETGNSE